MFRPPDIDAGKLFVQTSFPGTDTPEIETNLEQGVFVLSLSDFGERLPVMMGGKFAPDPDFPDLIFEPNLEDFNLNKLFHIYKGLQLHKFTELCVMILRETLALNTYIDADKVKSYFPTIKQEEADVLGEIIGMFINPGLAEFDFSVLKDIFDVWRINHLPPTNNQDENEVLSSVWFHPDIELEILKVISNFQHLFKNIKPLELFPILHSQIDLGLVSPFLAVMLDSRLKVIMEPTGRVCYYLPNGSRLLISVTPDIAAYSEEGWAFNLDIKSGPEKVNPAFADFKRMEYYLAHIQSQGLIERHKSDTERSATTDFYYNEYYPDSAPYSPVSINHIYPTKLVRTSLGEGYVSIPSNYRNKFPFQRQGDITDFSHQDFSISKLQIERQTGLLDSLGQRLISVKPEAWNILSTMKKASKTQEFKLRTDGELFTDLAEIRKYLKSRNYSDFFNFHNPYGEPPEQLPFESMDLREI